MDPGAAHAAGGAGPHPGSGACRGAPATREPPFGGASKLGGGWLSPGVWGGFRGVLSLNKKSHTPALR